MIDNLRSMAIFATVVDRGSFRAAAEHLNLAPSRISQSVSDLERELGVTLLYRSTRQMSMTNEGQVLHQKIREMLHAAETGLDAINLMSDQHIGELRITAPAFVAQTGMMDSFAEFAKSNSGINLKFNFSDYSRDLIKEGFDVAIRAGIMKDSDLMSRSIGFSERILVASPEYVSSQKTPNHPKDLEQWDWLHLSMRPERIDLTSDTGDTTSIACNSRIEVDSVHALYEFSARGLGFTPLPQHMATRGFKLGELVRVMPNWSISPLEFHAVWPDRSRRESITLIFVRFLADKSNNL